MGYVMAMFRGLWIATWILVCTPLSAATSLCVESTSAFINTLAQVPGLTDELHIKLRAGTYTFGGLVQTELSSAAGPRGRLQIEGGYDAGCQNRSNDAGATVLQSSANSADKRLRIEIGSENLLLRNFTMQSLDLEVVDTDPYNPSDYGRCRVADRSVVLRRLRLLQTYVLLDLACHRSKIENSYIVSRSGTTTDTVLRHRIVNPYIVRPEGYGDLTILYSTILGGAVRYDACCDITGEFGPGTAEIVNSVFDNDGIELQLDADVIVRNNRYDSASFSGGSVSSSNNITSPPSLQASGVPMAGSPLINNGTRFVDGAPSVDLAHNPRQVGTNPDIGAYETNVDDRFYLDVTNTQSSGANSFAAAVAAANATNGRQVIRFDITGPCPRIITLNQTLTLTDEIDIAGDTQPGTLTNTFATGFNGRPCIVLQAGPGVADGLVFNSSESDDDLSVRSIGFSGFSSGAIWIRSGSDHNIYGSQFGGTVGLFTLQDVGTAIRTSDTAHNVQVGGLDPAQANLIGNANFGLSLAGLGGNRVQGNAIGDAGFNRLPNTVAIALLSPGNRIEGNLIAGSSVVNVLLSGQNVQFNVVTDNAIIGATGTVGDGLSIQSGANRNRIGPDNSFQGNAGAGVRIFSGSFNDLSGNQFSGQGGLAIDLGTEGVTPNDDDPLFDGNTSANREQNFPVIELARRRTVLPFVWLDIEGTLRTTEGVYRIDVYRNNSCDASGHGEGLDWLGTVSLDVDCTILFNNQCSEPFELTVPGAGVDVGDSITAIATSPGKHTSEFAACRTVTQNLVLPSLLLSDGFED